MTTKTINTVEVGDRITNMWGQELDEPTIVTRIGYITHNGQPLRYMVYGDRGAAWPARDNDHRPIAVA